MFEEQVFAEGESLHIVEDATAREVCSGFVELQHGGTAEYNFKFRIAVIDVFQLLRPRAKRIAMYFINKQMGAAMCDMVFGQVHKPVVGKPKVIKRDIKSLRGSHADFLYALEHHRGLTDASGTSDAEHRDTPVYHVVHIAFETEVNSFHKAS